MKPRPVALFPCLLALALAAGARADFSYEQEARVTGGAMHAAVKVAGVFSKRARQPTRTRVVVKGPRMAVIGEKEITITDLDAETITTLYPKKRRRTVVTFEQMREYMKLMAAQAEEERSDSPDFNLQVSIEELGKTRQIDGREAKAFDLRLGVSGEDPETGESGGLEMLVRSWMSEPAPGYGEVREFHRALAGKLNWSPSGSMRMMTRMGNTSETELAKIYEAMAKIEGMAVLQETALGATGVQIGESKPAGANDQTQEEAGVGKSLKKALGGFGGFGRKKKKKEPEPPPQQAQASGAQASASLIEMEIRYFNFSNAPVDAALVETEPAGYKLVKSDIEKALE